MNCYKFQFLFPIKIHCVVPENIHATPEVIGNSKEERVLKAIFLKGKCEVEYLEFLEGWGFKPKTFNEGSMDIS